MRPSVLDALARVSDKQWATRFSGRRVSPKLGESDLQQKA